MVIRGMMKTAKTPQLRAPYPLAIKAIRPKVEIPNPHKSKTRATSGLS